MLSHYADVYDPGYIRRYNDTWQDTYGPGSSGYSYIYDIDGNGVPELIMNGGISRADAFIAVFTCYDASVDFMMFDTAAYGVVVLVSNSENMLVT